MTHDAIRYGIRKRTSLFVFFVLLWFVGGCTTIRYREPASVQKGMASWYGEDFHGKATSSREIYNMYDMTAAHRTLPFGTYVEVTNLKNGRSATVMINDRGPFVKGRIIDLSYAAARVLDMLETGVVPVRIDILKFITKKTFGGRFSVQVGSFSIKKNAEDLREQLDKKYQSVYFSSFKTSSHTYYRVRIRADSREHARSIALKLNSEGYTVLVLEEH